jgi:hypothetical protein
MFVGLSIGRPRLRRTARPPDASHAIPPRVLCFEASRHARIPSPSCWAFRLGFEDQTKKLSSDGFVGNPPNPSCSARPPAKPLDSIATVHRLDRPRLRLARLATMWLAPSPAVHRVLEPSVLVSPCPGGPSRLKTFRARSSPATTRTRSQPTPAH